MGSIKVLVVDDEREYVDALTERLAMRGVGVTGATSGDEALSMLAAAPVDVVVLDVMMPVRSGISTLVEIKKRHPQTAVIMLSGHADLETAIDGIELGAFDYLVKPVKLDELFYKIEDAYHAVAQD
jgi:DNA-binding response OmpR family regulator